MVTIEDLKRFPIKDVPPYGKCIVVPGTEFNPDWEDELCSKGHKIYMVAIDDKAMTLVKEGKGDVSEVVSKDVAQKQSSPKSPEKKTSEKAKREWTADEDELIIQAWEDPVLKLPVTEIAQNLAPKLPLRSTKAILMRIYHLRTADVLKGRKKRTVYTRDPEHKWAAPEKARLFKRMGELPGTLKEKAEKLLPEFPGRSNNSLLLAYTKVKREFKKVSSSAGAAAVAIDVHIAIEKLTKEVSDIKATIDAHIQATSKIADVLDKLSCAILMHALEIEEHKGVLCKGVRIPPGLWIHYGNALIEDDAKYREIFRGKVNKLLEAST